LRRRGNEKIDELLTVNLPGEFAVVSHTFDDGSVIYGMHFRCPCGCGSVDYVPIAPGDKKDHAWQWDGKPRVTDAFTVSIALHAVRVARIHAWRKMELVRRHAGRG
jgi:hypothetical protein